MPAGIGGAARPLSILRYRFAWACAWDSDRSFLDLSFGAGGVVGAFLCVYLGFFLLFHSLCHLIFDF